MDLAQFENQNVSRPNHDFCHFVVDLKEFFVGGRLLPEFNVLVLPSLYTHVIVNRLNLKYIRCAVMAEWLTHLTKDVGGTRVESFRIPVINSPPLDVNVYLGVFSYLQKSKV